MSRTNIITFWLQDAVGSKADIISQNKLFQLNKSLVMIVLCCVRNQGDKQRDAPANLLNI
jgi:hypothetical protein